MTSIRAQLTRAMPLRQLCYQLALVGIRLDVGAGYQLVASPRSALTPELAQALRDWKPDLYAFVRRYGPRVVPGPCSCCGVELVAEAGAYCPWCEVIRGREVSIAPGSMEESAYLASLNSLRELSQPSQSDSSWDSCGPVNPVRDSRTGSSICTRDARAHKENSRKQPSTVPNRPTALNAEQVDAFTSEVA